MTLSWSEPAYKGTGQALLYDVVATDTPWDFYGAGVCVESRDSDTAAVDTAVPAPGTFRAFIVRGSNSCATGSFGVATDGTPRAGKACP